VCSSDLLQLGPPRLKHRLRRTERLKQLRRRPRPHPGRHIETNPRFHIDVENRYFKLSDSFLSFIPYPLSFSLLFGGGVWESNPPGQALASPADGFEDRARHRTGFASE